MYAENAPRDQVVLGAGVEEDRATGDARTREHRLGRGATVLTSPSGDHLDDLREGKRTLMLIHLVGAVEGADAAFVESFLGLAPEDRDDDTLERVLELMVVHGSIEFAEDYARGIAGAALDAYDAAFARAASGDASRFVRGLVPYMLDRRP